MNASRPTFRIVGFDYEAVEPEKVPTEVVQWYDRPTRSWATVLHDQDGDSMDSSYDGTKAGAAAAKRTFERQIAEAAR